MIEAFIDQIDNGYFFWRVYQNDKCWEGFAESIEDARFAVALWSRLALEKMP